MQIREIKIDGFGIFIDKHIAGLSSGLNIIYGGNEDGKSTLLEFIRRILFGFESRKRTANPYTPVRGGDCAGALLCELRNGQSLSIHRTEGPKGGKVRLGTESGEQEGGTALESFLGHASREIYRNIYAFSIEELQNFDSLNGDEVKNRIYGAGLGLGALSLAKMEEDLDKNCDAIFAPKGKIKKTNTLLKEIQKLENEIQSIQQGLGRYDELNAKLENLERSRRKLKSEIQNLESRHRQLQLQNDLYRDYVELREAEARIAELKKFSPVTETTVKNFEQHQNDLKHLLERKPEEEEALHGLTVRRDHVAVDETLLQQESEILSLQQQTGQVQSSIRDTISVERERQGLEAEIRQDISHRGEGWTEEKVREFQLTATDENQISRFHAALAEAQQKVTSAQDKLDLHRESRAAEQSKGTETPAWLKAIAWVFLSVGIGVVLWAVYLANLPLIIFSILVSALAGVLVGLTYKGAGFRRREDRLEATLQERWKQALVEEEKINEDWQAWLRGKKLDLSLSPADTEKVLGKIRDMQSQIALKSDLDRRLAQMQETRADVATRVKKISAALPEIPLGGEAIACIELLGHLLDEAKKNRIERTGLQTQVEEQRGTLERLNNQIEEARGAIQDLFDSCGVKDEEEFQSRYRWAREKRDLEKTAEEKRKNIQTRVGFGEPCERFLETLGRRTPEQIQNELNEVQERMETLRGDRDQLNQDIGETRGTVDRLASGDDLFDRQTTLEIRKQQMRSLAHDWAAGKIALAVLNRAKQKFERERQPGVIKSAEKIFSQITGDRYRRIFKPIDSDEVRIAENGVGGSRTLMEMSRGTREQLYFSMRLGLIEEYETRTEPLPVVMDDVFVNFDDARGPRTIKLLARFAESRQVIVLTCHQHSLEAYLRHGAKKIQI